MIIIGKNLCLNQLIVKRIDRWLFVTQTFIIFISLDSKVAVVVISHLTMSDVDLEEGCEASDTSTAIDLEEEAMDTRQSVASIVTAASNVANGKSVLADCTSEVTCSSCKDRFNQISKIPR